MTIGYRTGGVILALAAILMMLVIDDHPCVEPDGSVRNDCEVKP